METWPNKKITLKILMEINDVIVRGNLYYN